MVELLEKVPPQAGEAEMAVLGAMLIEKEAIAKAIEIIEEKSFYREAHRWIYRVIIGLYSEDKAVDPLTVAEELRKQHLLSEVGGMAYLTQLIETVSTAAHVEYYARIVREKTILRELINAATQIVSDSYSQEDDVELILDKAESRIFAVVQRRVEKGFIPVSQLLTTVMETVETFFKNKEHVTGVPTGFKDFDLLTAGLQPANMVIIAGRPSMGKTAFSLNIAAHVGVEHKLPVAIFSLEMSRQELLLRILCSEARVSTHKLRGGFLPRESWTPLTTTASRLSESPIFLDDTPSLSVLEIRARARRLAAELHTQGKNLSLIIVDYLQLLRGHSRADNRQQEISEISRALKGLSRDLNVPLLALSQLSRRPEEKGREGRPQLSDLRESGALEQDADVVVFIYRESMYKPDDPDLQNKAKLIIAKQRNGPTGEVDLLFFRDFTRFETPSRIEV